MPASDAHHREAGGLADALVNGHFASPLGLATSGVGTKQYGRNYKQPIDLPGVYPYTQATAAA